MVRARALSSADYPLTDLIHRKWRKAQQPLLLVTIAAVALSFSYSISHNILPRTNVPALETGAGLRGRQGQQHLMAEDVARRSMPERQVAVRAGEAVQLTVPAEVKLRTLWEDPPALGLGACKSSQMAPAPAYTPQGYMLVICNGGLNQQKSAIVNAAAVARFLNMTLLVPYLKPHLVWNDTSRFEELYDMDRFVAALAGEVAIATHVESEALLKEVRIYQVVPENAPLDWYDKNVRAKLATSSERQRNASTSSILLKKQIIVFNPFAHRLAHTLPTFYQQLRCRTNYEALRFVPKVELFGDELVARMRKRSGGRYLALHLRFEKDMVAYSACDFGGGERERLDLQEYRRTHWDQSVRRSREKLDPVKQRRLGQCPMSPEEVGLFLRALGFTRGTHIYVATLVSAIYGGELAMAPLRQMFPNLVDKLQLASKEELAPFRKTASSLAALDYKLCVEANVFVPTATGNFPNFVMGHRVYKGFKKTIQPDNKRLAALLMQRGQLSWDDLAERIRQEHELKTGGPSKRGPNHNFFSNPRECLCPQSQPSSLL